mgnify:CR=1 FL=1
MFALAILNVCVTSGADVKLLSPLWLAVIVHEPAPVRWTVAPLIVHWPLALNETARFEVAVALTAKSASPKVLS